jgi:hypothetical protein
VAIPIWVKKGIDLWMTFTLRVEAMGWPHIREGEASLAVLSSRGALFKRD